MKEKTHQNNIEKKKLSRESREQFFFFLFPSTGESDT